MSVITIMLTFLNYGVKCEMLALVRQRQLMRATHGIVYTIIYYYTK